MKKLFSSLLCALSVSFSLVVGVPGATAQTAPLPRFLPPETAGYTLVDVAETSGQAGGDAYVGYFGNDANTRAIEVFALPARSSEYEALFKKSAKKGDRVHGKRLLSPKMTHRPPVGQSRKVLTRRLMSPGLRKATSTE